MKQYQQLVKDVLENGVDVSDRTGVGTKSLFGYQMRFNLQEGFPAVTTKKLAWKSVVAELLWFLEGSTDERRLAELTYGKPRDELVGKTTIWTANADKQGVDLGHYNDEYIKELGPVYGFNWRHFDYYPVSVSGVDQIQQILKQIKSTPDSRRIILTAWNPLLLDDMALPPCHLLTQFRVVNGLLSCQMYQRSADVGLGVPFNIASYALLTHMIARECGLGVGDYVHTIGDAHIYNNHIDAMKQLIEREPHPLPTLKIDPEFDLQDGLQHKFPFDATKMFVLEGYTHHAEIKMPMAV
jgi:thymidylate synthase